MKEFSDDDWLYLDDLQIGQRFTSGTHVVDEEQIKAFARPGKAQGGRVEDRTDASIAMTLSLPFVSCAKHRSLLGASGLRQVANTLHPSAKY